MLRGIGPSSTRRWGPALAVAAVMVLSSAAQAQADTGRVLLFHPDPAGRPDVSAGIKAIGEIGRTADLQVDATSSPGAFTGSSLSRYRAVVFLITPGARPDPASATGATTRTLEVGDRVHPSTRDLPLELNRTDVWYRWQTRPTGNVHTVARWRALADPAGDGTSTGGTDHPISWCRDIRGGRSFFTGMGRTADGYGDQSFRTHLLGAIQWATGLVRGNCKATINANYRGTRVVSGGPVETGLATSGESHGLTIAPNGWVIYIGRGDCRTDAERGALVDLPALGRILDHSDPNVGIGCGNVHVWDPAAYNGTVNSGVTRAGVLAVYGDGGQGGEAFGLKLGKYCM